VHRNRPSDGVLDLVGSSKFFAKSVVNKWPVPFSLRDSRAIALSVAEFLDGDLTLIVVSEMDAAPGRWTVRVLEPGLDRAHLEVRLDANGRFLCGSHLDTPVDELGAADALALYAPFIRGEWRDLHDPRPPLTKGVSAK
jgi:hypothetical protein